MGIHGWKSTLKFLFAAICCCWEMTEVIWLGESCFHAAELWLKQDTNHNTNIGLYSITGVKFAVQITVSCYVQIHWRGEWGKEAKERERRWRNRRLNFITGLLLLWQKAKSPYFHYPWLPFKAKFTMAFPVFKGHHWLSYTVKLQQARFCYLFLRWVK